MIKSGIDTEQLLMPLTIEDMISRENPIRLIKKFVDLIILQDTEKKFSSTGLYHTGRPAYPTAIMLCMLVFGYWRKIKSSRDLERAAKTDLEMIWLLNGLQPDHSTICDFISSNSKIVKEFNKDIRKNLKAWNLLKTDRVCFDGTKIKAYATHDMLSLSTTIENLSRAEDALQRYTGQIDSDDFQDEQLLLMQDKIKELEAEVAKNKTIIEYLKENEKNYYSPTDPDCNLMKFKDNGKNPAFNGQFGVDPDSQYITSEYATDSANDINELSKNIQEYTSEHGQVLDEVLVDGGYCNCDEIQKIESEQNIVVYSPSPKEKESKIKLDYDSTNDRYVCPQGKYLNFSSNAKPTKKTKRSSPSQRRIYVCKDCAGCPLRAECTTSKTGRHLSRFWNQEYRDHRKEFSKSKAMKERMKTRQATVEHIFGTLKTKLGYIPIERRGKEKVETILKIFTASYNIWHFINTQDFQQADAMLQVAIDAG
jgi:transposase